MTLLQGFIVASLVVLAAACLGSLAFMLWKPDVWALGVDKENNFWVMRGCISNALAEKIKKFEKGPALRITLGTGAILCLAILLLLLRSTPHRHFRAMLPPKSKPVPQRQPASPH